MQIRWADHRLLLWVGYEVDRSDDKGRPKWDGRRCRQNSTHGSQKLPATTINKALDNLEAKVGEVFYMFEMSNKVPVPKDLKAALNDKTTKEDIWSAYDAFVRHGETVKHWEPNTVKSVRSVGALLKEFRPTLTFAAVTPALMSELVSYMETHKLSKKTFARGGTGYSNATVVKYLRIVKWFFTWATKQAYIPESTWRDAIPEVKTIDRPVIFLEWPELMRLEAADFGAGTELERAADFFLFCCFTGLRYSDAAALLKSSVHDTYFEVVTVKTATPLRIELNDHSRRVLDKYHDDNSEYALPRITNNRLNYLLKVIGASIGLKTSVLSSQYYGSERIDYNLPKYTLLTTHCARRTFVCNALALGIPVHIVMRWTGHTEYASMRPYIEIADTLRAKAMARFNASGDNPYTNPEQK